MTITTDHNRTLNGITTNGATSYASYERVSTHIQGQTGYSLIAQHQSGEHFAWAQGWILPRSCASATARMPMPLARTWICRG